MRPRSQSPSQKVVTGVTRFVAGTHLYGKPRPSTLDCMLAIRKAERLGKQMTAKYGLDGKPPRNINTTPSAFTDAWDMFVAYIQTLLLASLKIALFFLFWGLMLMALPTVLKHL